MYLLFFWTVNVGSEVRDDSCLWGYFLWVHRGGGTSARRRSRGKQYTTELYMPLTSPSSSVFHVAVASVSDHPPRGALPASKACPTPLDDLWIYPHTLAGRPNHWGPIQGPCGEGISLARRLCT